MVDLGIDGLGDATEIGIGASAIVYRAAQKGLLRDVAIKVLVPSDEEFGRRFQREAVLLARLSQSPHVVTIHDTGVTRSGQPYLILQLCRGSLLDRIKTEGKIDPVEAVRIMAGIAAGVAHAHNLQVIHRDLKPGNILISEDGEYLVTDFGTSIVTGATTIQTSSISFTAGYVAPETVTGIASSFPVDVYALGATLFHMVSGAAPFLRSDIDSNIVALATRVVNDPVPDLRPLGVPDGLCRLIEWTMAKDPAARPTIVELKTGLASLSLNGEPQPAPDALLSAVPDRGPGTAEAPKLAARGILLDDDLPPFVGPETPLATPDSPRLGSEDQPWWAVALGNITHRLRTRHLVVGLSALLVFGLATAAAVGIFGGRGGGSDLASEAAGPVVIEANVADISVDEGPGSAAGAGGPVTTTATTAPEPSSTPTSRPTTSTSTTSTTDPNAGTVVVPSVVGLTEAEARTVVTTAGLVPGVVTRVFSPTVAPGLIVALSESGRVEEGITVDLVVSRGPAVSVPDLLALTETEAVSQLAVLGLTATVSTIESTGSPPGSVVSINPAPGTDVEAQSAVALEIAAPPAAPTVPNLTGLRVLAARTVLSDAGLVLGVVSRVHDGQAVGLILGSTPPSGAAVEAGMAIAIVVSLGPEPDPCLGVVGQTAVAAEAAIEAAGKTVQVVPGFSDVHPTDDVMACSYNTSNNTSNNVVILTVSQGSLNPVPVLVGLTRGKAQADLRAAGMKFIATEVFSSVVVGQVVASDPVAGTHYIEDSVVTISVSKGPKPTPSPDRDAAGRGSA